MTAKKRWFLKDNEEFLNRKDSRSDLNISWSSSSSEKDFPSKKFKGNQQSEEKFNEVNEWIKISAVPRKKRLVSSNVKVVPEERNVDNSSQFSCETVHAGSVRRSASSSCSFEESPIIGSLKLGEVSPVLGFTEGKLHNFKKSPVIGKRRILPAVVKKKNQEVKKVVNEVDEGDFKTQSLHMCPAKQSQVTIQSSLPNHSQIINKNQISYTVNQKVHLHNQESKCKSKFLTQGSYAIIENDSFTSSQILAEESDIKVSHDVRQFQSKTACTYSTLQLDTVIESNSPTCSQKTSITILTERSCDSPLNYTINSFISQEYPEPVSVIEPILTQSSEPCGDVSINSSETPSNKSPETIMNTNSTTASSEVKFITESTETSSSKSSSVEPLYHEILPKKRNRYKKDGLADQLQKALHKQKTDFAIWRHELYLLKTKGYKASSPVDENFILMKINKFWKEFGATIVECDFITNQADATQNQSFETCHKHVQNKSMKMELAKAESCQNKDIRNVHIDSKKCLVVIGFNVTHSLRIKINAKFKLCMPYKTKILKYNGELLFCYFNVSKLLSFK